MSTPLHDIEYIEFVFYIDTFKCVLYIEIIYLEYYIYIEEANTSSI